MNLSELRTFLAIVETGSLVRASGRLNVTQSTVTARLKSLEAELGQTLINRQKSGASLTAAGARLLRYAETISGLWQQARQETALPGGFDAVFNMVCHPDLWPGLGARLFDRVRRFQPSVALSVWQGGAAEMSGWLSSGLADLALTYAPSAQSTQSVRALGTDVLCLVSSAADSPVRFDPAYVFVEAGDEFGRWHAGTYADAGTARLNFGTAQLGLEHILTQGGSAYLPLRMAAPFLRDATLHRLDAPEFERPYHGVVNKMAAQGWGWLEAALDGL
ncbi:MAG: LysR family transcriptional regulator [Rhodobacter sp.]|nr:LysR family transcriptional regulator [Rhodobacter sp.]